MAAIWKGTISFGLVSVPVELHTAVRESRLSFKMLTEKGESPIHYKRVREDTGAEVPWKEIVKGFQVAKGEYVVLSDEDFTKAAVKQDDTLDIADFVEAATIDPRFYEGAYFLVPAKGGGRAYALLRDALAKTGMAGIGRIIVHQRQHVAEVRANGDALTLMLMRFAEELVDPATYDFPRQTVSGSRELAMAVELVKSLEGPFDPTKYVDEYDANLRKLIQARSKGRHAKLTSAPGEKRDAKVIDLMERLQKSLTAPKKAAARPRKRKTA